MRSLSTIILVLITQIGLAQLIVKPIIPQKKEVTTQSAYYKKATPATLPFWDDFSITNNSADAIRIWGNDTTSQWDYDQSKNVYINATLAINPPTYKVATFDGLDANGAFHVDNELRLADQLQSDTIDLSTYNESDNIFISFYWQAGGNVEKPDEGDSLRLQFYNPNSTDSNPWTTIWSMEGDENLADSIFTHEVLPVRQVFLTNKFVFRFQSFGDLDGPFDAWHVDWIYLNAGRSLDDKIDGYNDAAISGQLSSPFTPFSSLPIHQLTSDNKNIKNQSISLSYLDQTQIYQISINHIVRITNNNEVVLTDQRASNPLNSNESFKTITLGLNDPDIPDVFLNEQDFSTIQTLDSAVLESTVFFRNDNLNFNFSGNIDLRINDTIRTEYLLKNYYAYDDGTAEYAAGTNVLGGQVAVKFWLENQDTLTHVAIHFPNIAPPATGKSLTLNIFKSLNENNLAYRSQQINVKNDSSINGLTYYKLARPLVVSDTFYVSYQQNTNDYVGVGFDRSNTEASDFIYENNGDGWEKNIRIKGALMIRAIFEDVEEYTLGNSQPDVLKIFPNPTNGIVSIQGDYLSIQIMDISGRVFIQEDAKPNHDLSKLEVGLYLLKIHQLDGERTYKIIKK